MVYHVRIPITHTRMINELSVQLFLCHLYFFCCWQRIFGLPNLIMVSKEKEIWLWYHIIFSLQIWNLALGEQAYSNGTKIRSRWWLHVKLRYYASSCHNAYIAAAWRKSLRTSTCRCYKAWPSWSWNRVPSTRETKRECVRSSIWSHQNLVRYLRYPLIII